MMDGVQPQKYQKVTLLSNMSPAFITSYIVVISTVRSLLVDPDPDWAVGGEVYVAFTNNRPQYDETAREWTQKHAMD